VVYCLGHPVVILQGGSCRKLSKHN